MTCAVCCCGHKDHEHVKARTKHTHRLLGDCKYVSFTRPCKWWTCYCEDFHA